MQSLVLYRITINFKVLKKSFQLKTKNGKKNFKFFLNTMENLSNVILKQQKKRHYFDTFVSRDESRFCPCRFVAFVVGRSRLCQIIQKKILSFLSDSDYDTTFLLHHSLAHQQIKKNVCDINKIMSFLFN